MGCTWIKCEEDNTLSISQWMSRVLSVDSNEDPSVSIVDEGPADLVEALCDNDFRLFGTIKESTRRSDDEDESSCYALAVSSDGVADFLPLSCDDLPPSIEAMVQKLLVVTDTCKGFRVQIEEAGDKFSCGSELTNRQILNSLLRIKDGNLAIAVFVGETGDCEASCDNSIPEQVWRGAVYESADHPGLLCIKVTELPTSTSSEAWQWDDSENVEWDDFSPVEMD